MLQRCCDESAAFLAVLMLNAVALEVFQRRMFWPCLVSYWLTFDGRTACICVLLTLILLIVWNNEVCTLLLVIFLINFHGNCYVLMLD